MIFLLVVLRIKTKNHQLFGRLTDIFNPTGIGEYYPTV